VDAEVTWRNKMCQLYGTVSEGITDHNYRRIGDRIPRTAFFPGLDSGECG